MNSVVIPKSVFRDRPYGVELLSGKQRRKRGCFRLHSDKLLSFCILLAYRRFLFQIPFKKQRFITFFNGDVLYYTEVRWLSRGKVLKRFYALMTEIEIFMMKEKPGEELTDKKSFWDVVFLIDVAEHLNDLNLKFQKQNKMIYELLNDVRAFENKL